MKTADSYSVSVGGGGVLPPPSLSESFHSSFLSSDFSKKRRGEARGEEKEGYKKEEKEGRGGKGRS